MTEAEWIACEDPDTMLDFIWSKSVGRKAPQFASDRKMRLFAVGCCRLVWHHFADERSQHAIEAAERYAEGAISERDLNEAAQAARDAFTEALVAEGYPPGSDDSNVDPNYGGTIPFIAHSTTRAVDHAANWALSSYRFGWEDSEKCSLLRCVVYPFRPPPAIDPAWRHWHDATIPRLAQQMYGARDFASMPILADALEEAGCTSGDMLEHCRGAGPHLRGCWVVDLVLGKE